MTREEVKAQLAKFPLEWEETIYPDEVVAEAIDFCGSFKIQYTILGKSLGARGINYDSTLLGTCLFCEEEDPKAKAEDHRLLFACRMLGIND